MLSLPWAHVPSLARELFRSCKPRSLGKKKNFGERNMEGLYSREVGPEHTPRLFFMPLFSGLYTRDAAENLYSHFAQVVSPFDLGFVSLHVWGLQTPVFTICSLCVINPPYPHIYSVTFGCGENIKYITIRYVKGVGKVSYKEGSGQAPSLTKASQHY